MRGKRFKEEQIITVLKEAEAGVSVTELCRKYGICDGTFYNWKAKSDDKRSQAGPAAGRREQTSQTYRRRTGT